MFTKLAAITNEQKSLLPVYLEKWRAIALSTEAIARSQAEEVVKVTYKLTGEPNPKILFFDSPEAAISNEILSPILRQLNPPLTTQSKSILFRPKSPPLIEKLEWVPLWTPLMSQMMNQLVQQLNRPLIDYLISQLWTQLEDQVGYGVWDLLYYRQLESQLNWRLKRKLLWGRLQPFIWVFGSVLFDYCTSILNCFFDQEIWILFKAIAQDCGWIFPFQKTCLICERPIKLLFDSGLRVHAEGESAIEFRDGYKLYSFHGLRLPPKYGVVPPQQWQAQWIVEEANVEIRETFIKEIGYERMCQELSTLELDRWQEYTLIKIDISSDAMVDEVSKSLMFKTETNFKPIYLFKKFSDSTGNVQFLRVPSDNLSIPNIQSVSEALELLNFGQR